MNQAIKPPLGVSPTYIYEIQRIQNICRALYEYSYFNVPDINCDSMVKWCNELEQRLNSYKEIIKDKQKG